MTSHALTSAIPTNKSARLKSHGDVPRRTVLVGIQRIILAAGIVPACTGSVRLARISLATLPANLGQLPLALEVVMRGAPYDYHW